MDSSPKSILLIAGTGIISYAMTILKDDRIDSVLLILAGAAVFYLREWLKK